MMDLSKMSLAELLKLNTQLDFEIFTRLSWLFLFALVIFCLYSYYKLKIK